MGEFQKEINWYTLLEVSWIMANVAHGPIEIMEQLFFDVENEITRPSAALQIVLKGLQGNDKAH